MHLGTDLVLCYNSILSKEMNCEMSRRLTGLTLHNISQQVNNSTGSSNRAIPDGILRGFTS